MPGMISTVDTGRWGWRAVGPGESCMTAPPIRALCRNACRHGGEEVRVDAKAEFAAFLRVELGCYDVFACDNGGERPAILGLADHPVLVVWLDMIAVQKIE